MKKFTKGMSKKIQRERMRDFPGFGDSRNGNGNGKDRSSNKRKKTQQNSDTESKGVFKEVKFDHRKASEEVDRMLEHMARAATVEQILQTGSEGFRHMAGIVKCKSVERGLNRDESPDKERYKKETLIYSGFDPANDIPGIETRTQDFTGFRRIYCKALAENVISRALAYLAIGPEGVEQLKRGHAPFNPLAEEWAGYQFRSFDGKDVDALRWEWYFERHHRDRKSSVRLFIKTAKGKFILPEVDENGLISNLNSDDQIIEMPVNSMNQLVLICGGPMLAKDFHAYYHGGFQLAQEKDGIRTVWDGIHAVGPFYPCISDELMQQGGFNDVKEILSYLRSVGGDDFVRQLKSAGFLTNSNLVKLADGSYEKSGTWPEKILAFSHAAGRKPLQLGEEECKVAQAYRYVYEIHNITDEEMKILAPMNQGVVDYKSLTPEQRRWLQNSRRQEAQKISQQYAQKYFLGNSPVHQIPEVTSDWHVMPPNQWENYEHTSHLYKIAQGQYEKWIRRKHKENNHKTFPSHPKNRVRSSKRSNHRRLGK